MRCLMLLLVACFAASSYGFGLGSLSKALDKTATAVSTVNNALKAPTQQSQEAPCARPPQDRANPGNPLPTGAPAMPPGHGQPPSYANAPKTNPVPETAAGGNPPPPGAPAGYTPSASVANEKSVTSSSQSEEPRYQGASGLVAKDECVAMIMNAQANGVNIDQSWLNGKQFVNQKISVVDGWKKELKDRIELAKVEKQKAGAQRAEAQRAAQTKALAEDARDANDPVIGGSQVYDVAWEIDGMINRARDKGYAIAPPEWTKSTASYEGKRRSEIEKMKAEVQSLIDEAKGKVMAAANAALQKKIDERKALIAKCDEVAKQVDEAIKDYQKDRDETFLKCSQALNAAYLVAEERLFKSYADFASASLTDEGDAALRAKRAPDKDVVGYLKALEDNAAFLNYHRVLKDAFIPQSESDFINTCVWQKDEFLKTKDTSYPLDRKFIVQEKVLPGEFSKKCSLNGAGSSPGEKEYTERDLDSDISALRSHEKTLQESVAKCVTDCKKRLSDQSDRVAEAIGKWLDGAAQVAATETHMIDAAFWDMIRSERAEYHEQTLAKIEDLVKKFVSEVANNKKLAADRNALIKKLAAADVSTWLPEIEKCPKGEARDGVLGDALAAKFGSFAEYGKDSEALADLIAKLYSVDQQQKMLDSNKTAISVVIAIVSSIKDADFRKKLLLDSTDWAFHTYRKTGKEESQYAYLTLLSRERDVDVLMAAYEKQDRISFTYEKAAKSGGAKTAGDMLEQMWKNEQNNKGAGYGRLGLWMLDNCGKEFCQRVEKLTEARRKVAKGQMFIMNDFYLGMPHRDFKLVVKNWDKKKGWVTASFGTFNNRTLSEIKFGAKARFEYLGIKKDGLTGLGQFVTKYIPGGMDSVGELKVGAEAVEGYDPENPEIKVNTWWYADCPKYDCRVIMYDSGTICILYIGDDDYPTLDFSAVK